MEEMEESYHPVKTKLVEMYLAPLENVLSHL